MYLHSLIFLTLLQGAHSFTFVSHEFLRPSSSRYSSANSNVNKLIQSERAFVTSVFEKIKDLSNDAKLMESTISSCAKLTETTISKELIDRLLLFADKNGDEIGGSGGDDGEMRAMITAVIDSIQDVAKGDMERGT